ncbi:MAG: hypothetical protein AAFZ01_00775 [Pseudomonadota bacterium]
MIEPTEFDGTIILDETVSRKRIGVMALGTDAVLEDVFADMFTGLPVSIFVNRVVFENPVTMNSLAAMDADIERCLENILPGSPLDVVAFGCSSGTVAIGEDKLAARIRAVKPGAGVTNPVTAAASAFDALGVRRVSILTPYSKEVNRHVADFFLDKGLDVLNVVGFGVDDDRDIARIPAATITEGARAARHPDAEAVFLSCTALRSAHMAPSVEAQLGVPVVTSNQAMGWHALRLAGIEISVPGFGQLLDRPLAA